jgi:hypothetical protein
MSSLLEMLSQQLGGEALKKIGCQIGADEKSTGSAVSAALPLLINALSRNASTNEGANDLSNALSKDHDGSILDSLSGFLDSANSGPGDGILGHVLGARRPVVEAGLSKSSGLDVGSIGKLMGMLAPVVMGTLGKTARQKQMDSRSLAGYLGQERNAMEQSEPQTMGLLGKLLDADRDGDVDVSDLAKHGIGLMGKFFNR